jgi:hypothetical protein
MAGTQWDYGLPALSRRCGNISWQALANLKGRPAAGDAPFSDIAEVERHIRQECADFGPLTDEQGTHVAEHSVEPLDDGRYAPAWDPAVIRPRVAQASQK